MSGSARLETKQSRAHKLPPASSDALHVTTTLQHAHTMVPPKQTQQQHEGCVKSAWLSTPCPRVRIPTTNPSSKRQHHATTKPRSPQHKKRPCLQAVCRKKRVKAPTIWSACKATMQTSRPASLHQAIPAGQYFKPCVQRPTRSTVGQSSTLQLSQQVMGTSNAAQLLPPYGTILLQTKHMQHCSQHSTNQTHQPNTMQNSTQSTHAKEQKKSCKQKPAWSLAGYAHAPTNYSSPSSPKSAVIELTRAPTLQVTRVVCACRTARL